MLRCRQKFRSPPISKVEEYSFKTNEDGFSVLEPVDSYSKFCEPSDFDLKKLLDAGVPLQDVDTKILVQSQPTQQQANILDDLDAGGYEFGKVD